MSRPLLAPLAFALLLPVTALAESPRTESPSAQDRLESLIDRLIDQLEPGLEALGDMLGDMSGWHAPEILPNGDILIRRRAQPPAAPEDAPDTEDAAPPVTEPLEL